MPTPPSPQHPSRRLAFFKKYPEHPRSKGAVASLMARHKHLKPKQETPLKLSKWKKLRDGLKGLFKRVKA